MQPATAQETSPSKPVFNRKILIPFSFPHPDYPEGQKCEVRFPTDDEWCWRYRHQSNIRRTVTGGASVTEPKGQTEAAFELFNKIRQDGGGPEFEPEEAERVIDRLENSITLSVEREGNQYRIRLAVMQSLEVEHLLRTPTQKQLSNYKRAAWSSVTRRMLTEDRFYLEPAGELWDRLMVSVSGYAEPPDVPITHKQSAIFLLREAVEDEIKEGPAPEN